MADWHPIRVAARRTGLTPHVIRAWEKRYQAVEPRRTPTNRRLYSDQDIERLLLLRRATLVGRSISQVANLPTGKLRKLIEKDEAGLVVAPLRQVPTANPPQEGGKTASEFLEECQHAIQSLDVEGLRSALGHASVALSRPVILADLISVLLGWVGDTWRDGSLRVAHEHMASAVIRTFLNDLEGVAPIPSSTPILLVTTPSGQLHELGALIAATTAASEGWRILYLGPNMPAEEIASATQQSGARAVALSIVYPRDDPNLKSELLRLKQLLPAEGVTLLVGGRAAEAYADVLREIGAVGIMTLPEFRFQLELLRSRPAKK